MDVPSENQQPFSNYHFLFAIFPIFKSFEYIIWSINGCYTHCLVLSVTLVFPTKKSIQKHSLHVAMFCRNISPSKNYNVKDWQGDVIKFLPIAVAFKILYTFFSICLQCGKKVLLSNVVSIWTSIQLSQVSRLPSDVQVLF